MSNDHDDLDGDTPANGNQNAIQDTNAQQALGELTVVPGLGDLDMGDVPASLPEIAGDDVALPDIGETTSGGSAFDEPAPAPAATVPAAAPLAVQLDQVPVISSVTVDGKPAVDGTFTLEGEEGSNLTFDINAFDPDGGAVSIDFSEGAHGVVTYDPETGGYVYHPTDSNWFGEDTITVTVRDDEGNIVTHDITVNLTNVDDEAIATIDAPVVSVSELATDEDSAVSGTAGFSDADGETSSFYLLDAAGERVTELTTEHGTVSIDTATGEYTFTPGALDGMNVGDSVHDTFQVGAGTVQYASHTDNTVGTITTTFDIAGAGGNDVLHGDAGIDSVNVALNIVATDHDTSEAMTYTVAGVPSDLHLANDHGNLTAGADGSYSLSAEDLQGLNVSVAPGSDHGGFDLSVTATSHDGASTAAATSSLHVDVGLDAESGGNDTLDDGTSWTKTTDSTEHVLDLGDDASGKVVIQHGDGTADQVDFHSLDQIKW
ncbi:MAG TPA: hypothetical protein VK196_02540 [Magnetospirillum sp.]|nr:hypothetical protein [Magnetospirillum sp.]